MAYESGMPMHMAGAAMTWGSVWLLPPAIPLAIYMTLSTSNPGMIDAAANHWKESLTKVDDFKQAIEDIKKNFDSDKTNWEADDKEHFNNSLQDYMDELSKVRGTIETVQGLVEKTAIALFILCIIVLTVGTILLAIALLTLGALPIPVVGEIIYSWAQTAALMIMEVNIPIFTSIGGFFTAVSAFLGVCATFAGGAYGTQFVSLGTSAPNFSNVTINMPSGPIKA